MEVGSQGQLQYRDCSVPPGQTQLSHHLGQKLRVKDL